MQTWVSRSKAVDRIDGATTRPASCSAGRLRNSSGVLYNRHSTRRHHRSHFYFCCEDTVLSTSKSVIGGLNKISSPFLQRPHFAQQSAESVHILCTFRHFHYRRPGSEETRKRVFGHIHQGGSRHLRCVCLPCVLLSQHLRSGLQGTACSPVLFRINGELWFALVSVAVEFASSEAATACRGEARGDCNCPLLLSLPSRFALHWHRCHPDKAVNPLNS